MKAAFILFLSIFTLNSHAVIRCEGSKTTHYAGTKIYLTVEEIDTPVLSIYLVKGHRGGGSFNLIGKEKVKVEYLNAGDLRILSEEGVTLISIGKDSSYLEFGEFSEPVSCTGF